MIHNNKTSYFLRYYARFFGVMTVMCLYFWLTTVVQAATLGLSPNTGVYTTGATFTVSVVVNTEGQAINAIDGSLSFNPSELSVVSVTRAGSIFNLWTTEPTFSNAAGTISFGGGLPPPGYTGARGTVMSVTFRVNAAGTKRVSFSEASVLAADGRGTNVLSSMGSGTYTVTAATSAPAPERVIEYVAPANTPGLPQITSSTHSDPQGWYQTQVAELSWTLPAGVTAVRTLLNESPTSVPTNVYDTPISEITLDDLPDGESYFHLQFRNADGWGQVAHYRLAVDTEAPESFSISMPEEADMTQPEQSLIVAAEDSTSPITRYLVQLDGGEPLEYSELEDGGLITLPAVEPGYHTVVVEAFDAAGNSITQSLSFTVTSFTAPEITEYPQTLNEGVIPVIRGTTKPGAKVLVRLQKIGFEVGEYEVTANNEGVFTYIPEAALSRGTYELQVRATDSAGAVSELSAPVRIAVQPPGYITIGGLLISVMSVLVPLLAMAIVLLLLLGFGYRRVRSWRRGVTVETAEALTILNSEFLQLAAMLESETNAVKESRKSKKLTAAESHLTSSMMVALEEAQTRVKKEITDVQRVIK